MLLTRVNAHVVLSLTMSKMLLIIAIMYTPLQQVQLLRQQPLQPLQALPPPPIRQLPLVLLQVI